ncbi:unnamed protein product [Lymnaea stagnalis]|uniref:Uncharacterized protein n=1 Tax=Lymnaea stagnalis TaxID=6523 RepID=A0AAV2I168_LYMST
MIRHWKLTLYLMLFIAGILTYSILYRLVSSAGRKSREGNKDIVMYTPERQRTGQDIVSDFNAAETSQAFVERMAHILDEKLRLIPASETKDDSITCINEEVIGNSCSPKSCLQTQLPSSSRERVEQITRPNHLRISRNLTHLLQRMRNNVPGYYDLIVVTAVSSSHFTEARALLRNLQTNVFPHLNNFTFIVYNLGLDPFEVSFLSEVCKCHFIDFPFEHLPDFMAYLKCYTWKPIIINAHIQRAKFIMWVDASIRFHGDPEGLFGLLERAKYRGIQLGSARPTIAHVTLTSMFHFFGDEACAYSPYMSSLNSIIVAHNEEFVKKVLLEPWAACAVSGDCMCPQNVKDLMEIRINCHRDLGKYVYGVCHRFDQSALGIIGTKLYQGKSGYIFIKDLNSFVDVKRGDTDGVEKVDNPIRGNRTRQV